MESNLTENKKKKHIAKELLELVDAVAVAMVYVVLIFTLIFRVFIVSGESMFSTLHDYDRIIVSNLFYTPKAGDIIVFASEYKDEEVLVKRVIATAGQTVDITPDGNVTVDGKIIQEPYLRQGVKTLPNSTTLPYTVEKGHLFVMGDNRTKSLDSRSSLIGAVDCNKVLGRVVLRLFPNFGGV